ncbi:sulfur carrier protein ThiS [Peptostreptococcus faecalis]|uniref:sulfur carrier protein ThiS n=1 Tax=Peptostreptococcus faecalis TaxID=2045015 RepID=UPI000C7A0B04|nr:sulfur carrier protein ThiS [Peptostreptococcus faecalis]
MVFINGKKEEIEHSNLLEYLKEKKYDTKRIAVELNENVIKKELYEFTYLSDGDRVEIVCFVGGG